MDIDVGIVYLIQPSQLIGTERYKIGCSRDLNMVRCLAYNKGTRYIYTAECNEPFVVERKIKEVFNKKFKLISGNEYYEGNENAMKKEFLLIVMSFIDNIKEDKVITNYEEPYKIRTYEEWRMYTSIGKIIITNKKTHEGYICFKDLYWCKFEDGMNETLHDFIKQNKKELYKMISPDISKVKDKLIDCREMINNKYFYLNERETIKNEEYIFQDVIYEEDEIQKDIIEKCYVKNACFYNLKHNEFFVKDYNMTKYYILNTKDFTKKELPENEIIIQNNRGMRSIQLDNLETINIDIVDKIIDSLMNTNMKMKYKKLVYSVLVEASTEIIIFNDSNEKLFSSWLRDILYTLNGDNLYILSSDYYKDRIFQKDEIKKVIKEVNPRCVFIQYNEMYPNQIEEFKKLGFKNIIVEQDNNIKIYNVKNYKKYLEENKELILDLCVSNKNILNFEDNIFYDASLLQTEFLKWCCTR